MKDNRKPTLLQMQFRLQLKIIITVGIMAALILFVYFGRIPNPNMILIAGLVLCSALFGFGGGIVASVIMLGYTLFFFSTGHGFTQFTSENLQKVCVSIVGIIADMLLVSFLKRTELQAFEKIEALTGELYRENEKLQHISLTDGLTGCRNRMALRQDYNFYTSHEVVVMMLDLNGFKQINDTRGHEEGDRVLRETGKLLSDTFGQEHCYRYGGDEFLVIVPEVSASAFRDRLEAMERNRPRLDETTLLSYSVGYVHGKLDDEDTLRTLIANADERMYEEKRDKSRGSVSRQEPILPQARTAEYTVEELRTYLGEMSEKYDLARVVDPIECRILEFRDDGTINMNESCYGIWNAEKKCINCSSAIACRTGCRQEKAEFFRDNVYFIQSQPVTLKLPNGSAYDAVVELVKVEKDSELAANDREAENVGNRASHYLAHHDSLTNVLNADAFYELSRDLIKNSTGNSWVMVTGNIMNFRLVNNLFGVQKGNEVLVRTAHLLQGISEEARGLCGRLGSDQFVLLLPRESFKEAALTSASRNLEKAFSSGIYSFCIHFGVYKIDDPSIPISVMCGRANSALRTIRDDMTRTVAYFNQSILDKVLLEQKVIGGFDEALRMGQFKMYLQPLVGKDGSVIGAEALARWSRPDGAFLLPGDFIEVLENAGLIQKLDMHMWELAVRQLSAWKNTGKSKLSVSVNMSPKDFYSIDVYDVLTKLVEKYGVDSRMLRLEITESALLVDPDRSNAIISKLRKRGFLVEIDDFGKGFSSLGLLKNIKADVLKIDMSFLHEIRDRERSWIILKSVIAMADSLGMDVITEGVETKQQLRDLVEMGCRHFQGYYFSSPIPAEEFDKKVN